MRRAVYLFGLMAMLSLGTAARAQDGVWIQVEAQPSLAEGEDRARAWSTAFDNVAGYRLNSGWYGIVIGPFTAAEAAARLAQLKDEGMVPPDSYVTDGRPFRENFWTMAADVAPAGALPAPSPEVSLLEPAPQPLVVDPETGSVTDPSAPDPSATAAAPQADLPTVAEPVDPAPEVAPETVAVPALPDETPDEARRSEAALPTADKMELQTALKWYGFYDSAIDGAFGRGTRASMAAWQEANGHEATGVLTTAQRAALTGGYEADQSEFGFQTVTEAEAGIEIALPMGMVAFDHYEPPFVHFTERNGSGLRVVLISTPGDESTLTGLYETLQTLSILPEGGPRNRNASGFVIGGASSDVIGHAEVGLARGMVKGFILSGPQDKAAQLARILPAMKASFRSTGDKALDPGLVPMDDGTRSGLLSGLEVRKPRLSRSGFFVDTAGTVVTTAEAVAQCGRITLDRSTEARVTLVDAATGIAVLTPATPMAPRAVATFQTAAPRSGAEIAVSGYSYEDRLPAPILTFGALAETSGLEGEPGLMRLSLPVLAGDAGGPVVDRSGTVVGMLLPRDTSGARVLPEGVSFAATAAALAAGLSGAGVMPAETASDAPATPDALARASAAMTVLVSCWE